MKSRWIARGAAAAVRDRAVCRADVARADPTRGQVAGTPARTRGTAPACQVEGHREARLHGQGHARRRRQARRLQGEGHPPELLGDVVRARARWRSRSSSSCTREYKDQGLRGPRRLARRRSRNAARRSRAQKKMNYPCSSAATSRSSIDAHGPHLGAADLVLHRRATARSARKHIGPATKEQFEREIKALL